MTHNRPRLLQRAVECFFAQTYPRKELVILFEGDHHTRNFIEQLNDPRVKVVEVDPKPKQALGQLRNIAIERSEGEFFCQWDDDDWYHNLRLEYQMNCLRESFKDACLLSNWMVFDSNTGIAYLSFPKPQEGSILCRKSVFGQIRYPSMSRGEDTFFVSKLINENRAVLALKPTLYIYVYHGQNTWSYEHFQKFFRHSQELSSQSSILIGEILEGKFSNDQASDILFDRQILSELDYFKWFKD